MNLEVVQVTWRDATGDSGWKDTEETKKMLPDLITSVGYLLVKSDVMVILVQSINEESDQVDNTLVIPIENILNIDHETYGEHFG